MRYERKERKYEVRDALDKAVGVTIAGRNERNKRETGSETRSGARRVGGGRQERRQGFRRAANRRPVQNSVLPSGPFSLMKQCSANGVGHLVPGSGTGMEKGIFVLVAQSDRAIAS